MIEYQLDDAMPNFYECCGHLRWVLGTTRTDELVFQFDGNEMIIGYHEYGKTMYYERRFNIRLGTMLGCDYPMEHYSYQEEFTFETFEYFCILLKNLLNPSRSIDNIIKGSHALGLTLPNVKMTRNYLTDGIVFEGKEGELSREYTFEDWVCEFMNLNRGEV